MRDENELNEIRDFGLNFNRETRNQNKEKEVIDLGIDWITD